MSIALCSSTIPAVANHDRGNASRRRLMVGIVSCGFACSNLESAFAKQQLLPPPTYENNEFVQKLLERSRANKEKNDRERLENYNKRNYRDYFNFIQRTSSKDLSETEQKIAKWLEENK